MKLTKTKLKQLIKEELLEIRQWDYDPDESGISTRRPPSGRNTPLGASQAAARKAALEREKREAEEKRKAAEKSVESEGETDLERLVRDLAAESTLDYQDIMDRLETGFREKFEEEED